MRIERPCNVTYYELMSRPFVETDLFGLSAKRWGRRLTHKQEIAMEPIRNHCDYRPREWTDTETFRVFTISLCVLKGAK